jgi:hypothetical protein
MPELSPLRDQMRDIRSTWLKVLKSPSERVVWIKHPNSMSDARLPRRHTG